MKFYNKVIWITGASSGIGKSLAIQLSNEHTHLILSSRNTQALEEVKKQCKSPENIAVLPLDLEDYRAISVCIDRALAFFGRVDILFNNAGISQRALAKDTLLEIDERIMAINYFGTVALTKALLPHFLENKKGHFVITSSVVGKLGTPKRSAYAASKHALHGFFDSLRAEVHDANIKVTLVCPGYVQTNVSINALTGSGSSQNKMDKTTANGLSSDFFVKKMLRAVAREKQEVVIGGLKEVAGVYVKRFFPKLLSRMVRKVPVT